MRKIIFRIWPAKKKFTARPWKSCWMCEKKTFTACPWDHAQESGGASPVSASTLWPRVGLGVLRNCNSNWKNYVFYRGDPLFPPLDVLDLACGAKKSFSSPLGVPNLACGAKKKHSPAGPVESGGSENAKNHFSQWPAKKKTFTAAQKISGN